MIERTADWDAGHPGSVVGVLALDGLAGADAERLGPAKAALVDDLTARFGGQPADAIRATPPLPSYAAYYRRYGQRYHVGMQLESIVLKGRGLPDRGALVDAMFLAELRTLILTAGHDRDALAPPLQLRRGAGADEDRYPRLGGGEATAKPDDLCLADADGVLAAVVTGPAARGALGPATGRLLFTAYGPPGVGAAAMEDHLAELERMVRLPAPGAAVVFRAVVP